MEMNVAHVYSFDMFAADIILWDREYCVFGPNTVIHVFPKKVFRINFGK